MSIKQDGRFGVMLDMSRNGVMRVSEVKRYVDYISAFGYNSLQLYTEDTYEMEGEPFFGYLRGRYTREELKEIDAYCLSKGVELIPCIQTLAHLNQIFRWDAYAPINDTRDILLVGDERTYALIDKMFKTAAECFTSRKINIGMDEAFMLGCGKYLERNGYRKGYEIIREHLDRVLIIAKKYGFSPMMWSDMFFRLATGGPYAIPEKGLDEAAFQAVPQEISLIYWDYYSTDGKHYKEMIAAHQQFNRDLWFAGGAWTWVGFAPANHFSIKSMEKAMVACKQAGLNNVFITVWGDNGRECSPFAILPTLFYLKRYYDGVRDKRAIKAEFFELTGESFDNMMDLDLPNMVAGNKDTYLNPCKHMLYNDPFLGYFDTTCSDGVEEEYAKYAKRLARYTAKKTPLAYLYDSSAKLCKALSYKYALGAKTRKHYQAKDIDGLKSLISTYKKAEQAVKEFYQSFQALWHKECKPFGFEIQDARIGGLIHRLEVCRKKLQDYVLGKTDKIEELEAELLDYWDGNAPAKQIPVYQDYKTNISNSAY